MGLAPEPGVGRRAALTETSKSVLNIEYDGKPLTLAWKSLPMGERLACRKATGLPFEAFTDSLSASGANVIGEDSLCVAWWMARRANGEAQLEYEQAVAEWDVSLVGTIRSDSPDLGDDSPEA